MTPRRANGGLAVFAAAACIGLGYMLYLESMTPPSGSIRAATDVPGDKAAPDRLSKNPLAAPQPITRFQETLNRPLFRKSRRRSAPGTGENATAPTALPIRLVGVVITPERRTALIREENSSGITEIAVGQTLQGWVLERILPDRIVLKSGTLRETYRLETEAEIAVPPSRARRRVFRRPNKGRRIPSANPRR